MLTSSCTRTSSIARGRTPDAARREARLAFGNPRAKLEEVDALNRIPLVETFWHDLRYAFRQLRLGPNWVAILMLALAIGLTTATFSIFDALFLRPIPFKDADRLAYVNVRQQGHVPQSYMGSLASLEGQRHLRGRRRHARVVDRRHPDRDRADGAAERRKSRLARWRLSGFAPCAAGRSATTMRIAGNVVIISEDLWTDAFGRDERAVGASVELDGKPAVVVGVLPRTFRFPSRDTEVWRPIAEGTVGPGTFNRAGCDCPVSKRRAVGRDAQARRRDCPSGGSFDRGHGSRAGKACRLHRPDQ